MIRVVTIENGGAGKGHDLTDDIEGLSYSNVEPGGDELANFTYKRPWSNALPEVAKGNLLVIQDGLDVLWQGRIGEPARGGSETEEMQVTGYGTGIRLKDGQLERIYVDSDLSKWRGMSRTRRLALISGGLYTVIQEPSAEADTATGDQSLKMPLSGTWGTGAVSETVYDAGELARIGEVEYDWSSEVFSGADGRLNAADDDALNGLSAGTDRVTAATSGSELETIASQRVVSFSLSYGSAVATDAERSWTLTNLRVRGDHGLTPEGGGGFFAATMIEDAIGDVDGVLARTIDASDFEIEQAVSADTHEALVRDLTRYHEHERAWGTWGPDGVFDPLGDGHFDWTERPSEAEWIAPREDFEALSLNSELEALFDTVILAYTDSSGTARQVVRTLTSSDLEAAGMSGKTARVNGGRLTPAAATVIADAILAWNGGYAPASGQATIARPIRHTTRGELPPHYLRADGALLRIPDILPSSTLFALDDTPDRRTTFPIKRVRVDLSGAYPKATVELDQTNHLVSTLQARADLAGSLA